jgi:putative SOS response-associated peptidase YedK
MCTAYELGNGKRQETFPAWLQERSIRELLGIDAVQFMRPTNPAPVVMPDGSLRTMRWGFQRRVPGVTKILYKPIVNAREDKLASRTWKTAIDERRCLIPASAYYEWSGPSGNKRTHRFTRTDDALMWIAGIWEDGKDFGECFSMITTEPNAVAAAVHDRMPAVLREEELLPFLQGDIKAFLPEVETLCVTDAPNPLRRGKPPMPDDLLL